MSQSIVERVEASLQREDLDLPVLDTVSAELQKLLTAEDFNLDRAAALIQRDPALAGQILRVANSAFFSGLGTVTTVGEAILRLGARQVSNLVTLVTQKKNFHSGNPLVDRYLKTLWAHSVAVAGGSSWLAAKIGYRSRAAEAFLAGLLHDFGKLFLLRVVADLVKERDAELSEALILEILRKMHCEQGARLMQAWNMPEVYRDVARMHHQDLPAGAPVLVHIVRLTDIAANKAGVGMEPSGDVVLSTTPAALALGAGEVLLAELEIAIEDAVGLADTL